MRMSLRSLLALLTIAVATTAASGVSAAPRDRCNRDDRSTVALTPQQRVYVGTLDSYNTCMRSTGRSTELFVNDDIYTYGQLHAVAGRYVAYTVNHVPECKADCPPGVVSTNITSVTDAGNGRTRDLFDGRVGALRLRPTGSVAWVGYGGPDGAELAIWTAAGRTTVDTGDITHVVTTKTMLTWQHAGTTRRIAFR
ncbi:MAG: hypothetical protein QOG68_113 [Solirubrobacteraceae bacterium]|nr:hypothetical protein [Solirubrobacteraceae bacterium]